MNLGDLRHVALGIGIVAFGIMALALAMDPPAFFQAYLLGFAFWIQIPLGCLALLLIHRLTGGPWGFHMGSALSAGAAGLWFFTILFLPLLFGLESLYPWVGAEAAEPWLARKAPYLDEPFFVARAVFYFTVWIGLPLRLRRLPPPGSPGWNGRSAQAVASAGLILYALTGTFAAIDWLMALEPRFHSSIYGLQWLLGQALVAVALATLIATLTRRPDGAEAAAMYRDFGNLLLLFVLGWTYAAFSQFLIIWSGDLPHEIAWYLPRRSGFWGTVAVGILVFHFALPLAILLSRKGKRMPRVLGGVAALVLIAHALEVWWLVAPAFEAARPWDRWLDLPGFLAVGGVWLALFLWLLAREPAPAAGAGGARERSAHER